MKDFAFQPISRRKFLGGIIGVLVAENTSKIDKQKAVRHTDQPKTDKKEDRYGPLR